MADKKLIVVTGGAGFIGSHLCERLVHDGHRVISLDNHFTGSKDNHVKGVEYREGHTKDIAKHITETPDIIYHLGEYSRVEISLTEPALVWDLNKDGTFGVVEFWRQKNKEAKCKLVYAGSSTKFGDGGLARIETPYAWSKASNTELVQNYGRWYVLPYAVTYFYNVYGPGERAGKYGTVIEIFKQKKLAGEPLGVNAPGTQKRNFTHVDDIIDGLVLVGERGEGDEFGLGAQESYSILEVAQMFGSSIEMRPEVAGNRMDSTLDATKSRALGWVPTRKLAEYIKGTPQ
jgi:UDP-glucose 4-epimerase